MEGHSENTNWCNKSEQLRFVMDFYRKVADYNLSFVYEGQVTEDITAAFAALAEKKMDKTDEDQKIKRNIHHVMVEFLQNISKHADDDSLTASSTLKNGLSKSCVFIVGADLESYFVISGNLILNDRIEQLKSTLDHVNGLDADQLKELHKKKLKETRLSEKGGAGLGFIDIVRKTGNPLEYYFEAMDEKTSFVLMRSNISKPTA